MGLETEVLFEDDVTNGLMEGFTPNYIRVAAKYDPLLVGEMKRLRLTGVNPSGPDGSRRNGLRSVAALASRSQHLRSVRIRYCCTKQEVPRS